MAIGFTSAKIVLLPSTTVGVGTATGPVLNIVDPYTAADVVPSVTAVSGAGTLKVFIQKEVGDEGNNGDAAGTIINDPTLVVYDDFIAHTQMTSMGKDVASVIAGSSVVHAPSDAALAAATVIGVVVSRLEEGQNLNLAVPISYVKSLLDSTREVTLDALPKPNSQPHSENGSSEVQRTKATDQEAAVQVIRHVADLTRQCHEESTTHGRSYQYYRDHYGPPTDVRYDLQKSDSLVAPYTGVVEFTIHFGRTRMWTTSYQTTLDDCLSPTDPAYPEFCYNRRHRHIFRVSPQGAELQYRLSFNASVGQWVEEKGDEASPSHCWESIVTATARP